MSSGRRRRSTIFDPDARDLIRRVQAADGQPLEEAIRRAYNLFFVSCKRVGIRDAIKAIGFAPGARTLAGFLTPMVGVAPTAFNFNSSDYSRIAGLTGNGLNKYILTNRNNNEEPQNNKHVALNITTPNTKRNFSRFIAAGNSTQGDTYIVSGETVETRLGFASNGGNSFVPGTSDTSIGFLASSRNSSTSYTVLVNENSFNVLSDSRPPRDEIYTLFGRPADSPVRFVNAGINFYSIGNDINLVVYRSIVDRLLSDVARGIS